MKSLFPQYAETSKQDYANVWKQALFVFDTNVLLNLYRYQSGTRDELLNVLNQLSDRIWIPHHVGLEFQRNRLKVIAEQNKRFTEVRRTIEKARSSLFAELDKLQLQKRHSLINPQPLTSGFETLVEKFLTDLDTLQEAQQKLSAPDPLKEKIETLFDRRVGVPPKDQDVIDDFYKKAEERFKLKIPPGYQDVDKDKDEPDEYIHRGIIYKRKYGDYLVWQQLIAHAKASNAKSIIFVTDDGKDDWWNKIESDGTKTIGPRPELVDEAQMFASVETLLMYSPEGFLKYAKEFLQAPVSDATLKEVRDVSITRSMSNVDIRREFHEKFLRVEKEVLLWLEDSFDNVVVNQFGFPDLLVERDGELLGYEIKFVNIKRMSSQRVRDIVFRINADYKDCGCSEITIVWIVNNLSEINELKRIIFLSIRDEMPKNIRMIIGVFDDIESGGAGFILNDNFAYNESDPSFQRLSSIINL